MDSSETPNAPIVPDARYQAIAEAYTLDAIDHANAAFKIALDKSEVSIQQVERILGGMHDAMATDTPSDDAIETFSKMYGSYIGEVFRSHHAGEWVLTTNGDGSSFPGIQRPNGIFWPWMRVHKRLTNGPEDNVYHYYMFLTEQATGVQQFKIVDKIVAGRPTPPKKNWFSKLIGR